MEKVVAAHSQRVFMLATCQHNITVHPDASKNDLFFCTPSRSPLIAVTCVVDITQCIMTLEV